MTRESILNAFPELEQIQDKGLREKCCDTWLAVIEESRTTEDELMKTLCHKSLKDCPVTLIGHTRGVMQLAIRIAEQFINDFSQYVPLSMDYVIAAACLHDVGKVYEHVRDENGELTWAAKYLHHPITGAAAAMRTGCPAEIVYAIAYHSHEGDAEAKKRVSPLLYVIRMADENYYEYLFYGFEKKAKASW